ncbi:hypothetical protein HZS_2274 [Henneguya salminicola]|nr:hypothetical protein HZS_2274 [Henneguya salminicola]
MLSIYIYILFYKILHAKCEDNFDIISNQINVLTTVKIFGVKTIGNTGQILGCCGDSKLSECLPCQYSISGILMQAQLKDFLLYVSAFRMVVDKLIFESLIRLPVQYSGCDVKCFLPVMLIYSINKIILITDKILD